MKFIRTLKYFIQMRVLKGIDLFCSFLVTVLKLILAVAICFSSIFNYFYGKINK